MGMSFNNKKGALTNDITEILKLKNKSIEDAKALELAKTSKPTNFLDKEKEDKALLKKKKAELHSQQQKAKAKEDKLQKAKHTQQSTNEDNTNEETK